MISCSVTEGTAYADLRSSDPSYQEEVVSRILCTLFQLLQICYPPVSRMKPIVGDYKEGSLEVHSNQIHIRIFSLCHKCHFVCIYYATDTWYIGPLSICNYAKFDSPGSLLM